MTLAIFDLDNTLLAGDSDHLWGQYLVDRELVDAETYERENERFYREYREGNLDIFEFLAFSLKPLAEHSLEELYSWRYEFVKTSILPIIPDAAKQLVERHRQQGDTLLVITATNRFVTEPIVEIFGIDNLLATDPELNNHAYTGKVAGTPCFQEGKVARLNSWLEETGHVLQGSWFYSDSHNDLPLLKLVDNPVAVDPDEILTEFASDNGWPIISLRN
jgi:HAD superfamily hydrolase (TIGR01490 family)